MEGWLTEHIEQMRQPRVVTLGFLCNVQSALAQTVYADNRRRAKTKNQERGKAALMALELLDAFRPYIDQQLAINETKDATLITFHTTPY